MRFFYGAAFQGGRIAVDRLRDLSWDDVVEAIERFFGGLPF